MPGNHTKRNRNIKRNRKRDNAKSMRAYRQRKKAAGNSVASRPDSKSSLAERAEAAREAYQNDREKDAKQNRKKNAKRMREQRKTRTNEDRKKDAKQMREERIKRRKKSKRRMLGREQKN